MSALDQEISKEVIALGNQVAAKDHELSETRAACLAAQGKARPDLIPTPRPSQSHCRTMIAVSNGEGGTFSAHPQGDYETALTSAAEERDALQSQIAAKEQLRAQRQQRLEQVCFGAAAQDLTAKEPQAR